MTKEEIIKLYRQYATVEYIAKKNKSTVKKVNAVIHSMLPYDEIRRIETAKKV